MGPIIEYLQASGRQIEDRYYHYQQASHETVEVFYVELAMGRVDMSLLQRAVEAIVARHDGLRACFPLVDGKVVLAVYGYQPWLAAVTFYDLSQEEDAEEVQESIRVDMTKKVCDLCNPPLFRVWVCKIGEGIMQLSLLLHHIIADAESFEIIKNELRSFYKLLYHGGTPVIEPLPPQLRDYCVRQVGAAARRQEVSTAFWRERFDRVYGRGLRGASGGLAGQGGTGAFNSHIDGELTDRLRKEARSVNCSIWSLLYVSFCLLLHKLLGVDPVVIVTTVSDRWSPANKGVVGNLAGTVYLVVNVDTSLMVKELVRMVHADFLKACRHNIFNHLALGLDDDNILHYCDLFANFEPATGEKLADIPDMGHQPGGSCYYSLNCNVREYEHGLICKWNYSYSAYSRGDIERIALSHLSLLERLVPC